MDGCFFFSPSVLPRFQQQAKHSVAQGKSAYTKVTFKIMKCELCDRFFFLFFPPTLPSHQFLLDMQKKRNVSKLCAGVVLSCPPRYTTWGDLLLVVNRISSPPFQLYPAGQNLVFTQYRRVRAIHSYNMCIHSSLSLRLICVHCTTTRTSIQFECLEGIGRRLDGGGWCSTLVSTESI